MGFYREAFKKKLERRRKREDYTARRKKGNRVEWGDTAKAAKSLGTFCGKYYTNSLCSEVSPFYDDLRQHAPTTTLLL